MLTADRLERLKNLSPAKRALLLKQAQEKATPDEAFKLIPRRAQQNPSPLSFAQQRLWFLNRLEPDSAAYNIPVALRLTGRLDHPALERTLNEVVRRHESLRTTFREEEGRPVQVVAPFERRPLPVKDLAALSEEEREAEVERQAAAERRAPFDLAEDALLRVTLLRLGEEEHVLLVTMHHIVSDGWSVGVLVRELTALYTAYIRGEESPLEEPPVQYADYAVWQRAHLSGENLERQLAYWRERLAGAPALLGLPTDRPRPAVQSYRGATLSLVLPAELVAELRRVGQAQGCTLFMTLLAGWQALLSRYAGQEDIVVGTPVANRTRRETEGLIGFFVNTLALRTDCSGDPSFVELLGRVREVTLGAYAHQEVPFERLVEELAPERSLSHQPIFQVVFALQNAPRESLRLPGLELSALSGRGVTAKFDLALSLTEGEGGVAGALEYRTDLFDETTAEQLLSHYVLMLETLVANPSGRVRAARLLGESEERRLLHEWNRTRQEY
ncbi:MAG TPA: condensation domain-containing protein, partial [Pyrinomonadaceae bacterium]|nr:condensation domain-containing protein [Pyrinomonadaceae bacterium]